MSFNARAAPAPGKQQRRRAEKKSEEKGREDLCKPCCSARWAAAQAHTLCSTVRSRSVVVDGDVEAARQASGSGRMNDLCVLD